MQISNLSITLLSLTLSLPALARPDGARSSADECEHARTLFAADTRTPGFINPDTGRDLLNYPPHPHVAYQHMALKLDIADMNIPKLEAEQHLTFTPVGDVLDFLQLDAKLLDIHSVKISNAKTKVSFKHDGQKLNLAFDPPLPVGEKTELLTTYTVNNPRAGLIWTPQSKEWPDRPAQLHTQGQSNQNSYWFPCHDFPNVRLTTEITVTVPDDYQVSSNGKLLESSHSVLGRTTFHWLQDKPHTNYLVSLIVGKFDVENISTTKLPMPVYVPQGRGPDIARTYGHTPQMISLFEKLTSQPYPWDQYAQLVVHNFGGGGMENTSATTLYDTAILTPEGLADGDIDGLIAHELAHQWFGDLITCKSWEHIWLNEGFATYFSNLWFENRDGKDAYYGWILSNTDRITARDRADAPYQPAMVSKEYKNPGETFSRAANPYPKGSVILHMLRQRLGDEIFFKALGVYVDRFKFKQVETNDLRRIFEEVSGEALEQFFRQWCYHPGIPELDIACDWKAESGELVVSIDQKQTIDGYNPAFEFSLPIWVQTRSGASNKPTIEVNGRETVARFKLDSEPTMVIVDPELTVLAVKSVKQPLRRWLSQLDRGPTALSRILAARYLATEATTTGAASLTQIAAESSNPSRVRWECIDALVLRHEAASLAELSRTAIADRDVREVLIDGIAESLSKNTAAPSDRQRLIDYLTTAATKDQSAHNRQSALRGLGKLKLHDKFPILADALAIDSQHDRIRQGALEGLGDLDAPEGLPLAIQYAQFGNFSRTRPVAIEAIAKLAHHDQPAAIKALLSLQSDRETRSRNQAAQALITLHAEAALPAWEAQLKTEKDPQVITQLQDWIAALKTKPAPKK